MKYVMRFYDENDEKLSESDEFEATDWLDALGTAYWIVRDEDRSDMEVVSCVQIDRA